MKRLIEQAKRQAIALEQLLDVRMNTLVRPAARPLEPLEIRNAILREIERQIIPGPQGTRVFPYNDVTVELLEREPPQNASLDATLDAGGGLEAAARQRVAQARSGVPRDFVLRVVRIAAKSDEWPSEDLYRVRFDRVAPSHRPEQDATASTLVLTLGGASGPNIYRMTHGRMDIGRVGEVRDRDGRLVRRNAVVVLDAQDPDGTVSRRHAHVKTTVDSDGRRHFALYDDGSRYGTRIVRDGETVTVHAGTKGVRLRDGDELHFGDVCMAVRLEA
jgi:hypothetical protein